MLPPRARRHAGADLWRRRCSRTCRCARSSSRTRTSSTRSTTRTIAAARSVAYETLDELVANVEAAVKSGAERKFVYAYWPVYDMLSHRFGAESAEAFAALEHRRGVRSAARAARRAPSRHRHRRSRLHRRAPEDSLERFASLLRLPRVRGGAWSTATCTTPAWREGEGLARRARRRDAEPRAGRRGWFGPGTPHPRFAERIGDVALVMRGRTTVKDWTGRVAPPAHRQPRRHERGRDADSSGHGDDMKAKINGIEVNYEIHGKEGAPAHLQPFARLQPAHGPAARRVRGPLQHPALRHPRPRRGEAPKGAYIARHAGGGLRQLLAELKIRRTHYCGRRWAA